MGAAVAAVVVQRDPFVRLIPADVLRDYRSGCFASTQCKVFKPNETWPLAPFCGRSRCVALKVTSKSGKESIKLAEEVTDCGPVIDIEKTPDCALLRSIQCNLSIPIMLSSIRLRRRCRHYIRCNKE